MKKSLISSIVILSLSFNLSSFAFEKVSFDRECNKDGCQSLKKTISHKNGHKFVNTVECKDGICVNTSERTKYNDDGSNITKKKVCLSNGGCEVTIVTSAS